MKVYAAASIAGNKKTEKRTPADYNNGTNPAWNFTIRYTVGEEAVQQEGVSLVVKLFCKRTLGDRYIGEVQTSIKQLYNHAVANGGGGTLSYKVCRGSVESQGDLKLSFSIGKKMVIEESSREWKTLVARGAVIMLRTAFVVLGGADILLDVL